jgi:hypothetical protein
MKKIKIKMSTENDYLIKQLERRYNSLTNLDIRGFFIGLADYVKFVIETPKLISIVDTYILEEKRGDTKKFEDLKNKAKEDLVRFGNELLKEIERAKVVLSTDKETSQLKELILEFKQLENFKSEMDVDVFERILVDIIKLLRKNKIKNIPQLARKNPDVNFIKKEEEIYFFPDSYFDYSLERSYYEVLQSKTTCGAWAELYPIYVAMYKRKEWELGAFSSEPIKKYTEAVKVLNALELLDEIFQPELVEITHKKELELLEMIHKSLGRKVELKNTSEERKNSSLKAKYLSYLTLVHNYFIQELSKNQIKKTHKKKRNEISFSEDGILNFQGKSIQFQIDTDPYYLLKTIFKNPTKIWNYDEIADDWGLSYEEKPPWKRFYNAGYQINTKIAKETTVKDFLKLTNKTVNINQKYLRS